MASKYEWQHWPTPNLPIPYPPSLKTIPEDLDVPLEHIFDPFALAQARDMIDNNLVPFKGLWPETATAVKDLVSFNVERHHAAQTIPNMYTAPNVGLRTTDWYTDAVFGQQQFTGTNPVTLTIASSKWTSEFKDAATSQGRADVVKILTEDPKSLYVQDYSYFRPHMHLPLGIELPHRGDDPQDDPSRPPSFDCAPVVLFHLEAGGKLHPLAVTIDYKESVTKSVTIFNKRVLAGAPGDEATDWPWRYAKMCVQVADWLVHEVSVHLVHTHLIVEVYLVAAHRAFPPKHIVLELLEGHQDVTFSVNKAARETLVPGIVIPLTGFPAPVVATFLRSSFDNFNWTDSYVPNDLKRRGFPVAVLDQPKYRNYAFARGIADMWAILRKFVATVLTKAYHGGDAQVKGDTALTTWCEEMRGEQQGQLKSFPSSITTLEELIDVVTMCIHIASPQHTAINYLQQYYMNFVPNRPSALYTPLPKSLEELQAYKEEDVFMAIPVRYEREWLLMLQIPYLLSFTPPRERSLFSYAVQTANSSVSNPIIREGCKVLKTDLEDFIPRLVKYSQAMDNQAQEAPYLVLHPNDSTSSIII